MLFVGYIYIGICIYITLVAGKKGEIIRIYIIFVYQNNIYIRIITRFNNNYTSDSLRKLLITHLHSLTYVLT